MFALLSNKNFYVFVFIVALVVLGGGYIADQLIIPTYTMHNEGLTVPDVTKIPIERAKQVLHDYGLRDSIIDKRYNAAFPANYVIDQTPSPSLIVKPNRKIYLTVNTSSTPKVIVPALMNLSLRNAELQLNNYGLKLGNISYTSSPFKNSVIKQNIPEGTAVDRGTVISLVVSDGLGVKKVPKPDLVGKKLNETQALLRTLGLRIGEIRFKPVVNQESNLIISFEPSTQDSLIEGTKVNLVVSEQKSTQEVFESGAVIVDSTGTNQAAVDSTSNQ